MPTAYKRRLKMGRKEGFYLFLGNIFDITSQGVSFYCFQCQVDSVDFSSETLTKREN